MDLWRILMPLRRPRPLLAMLCFVLAATILVVDGAIVRGQSPDPPPSPVATPEESVGSPVPPLTATVGTVTSTPGISVTPSAAPSIVASAIIPVEPPVVPTATNTPVLPPTPTNVPGPALSPTPFPSVYPTQAIWTEPLPTFVTDQSEPANSPSMPFLPPKSAQQGKLDFSLRTIASAHQTRTLTTTERDLYNIGADDFIEVIIELETDNVAVTEAAVKALGGSVRSRIDFSGTTVLSGRIPLSQLAALDNILTIRYVRLASISTNQSAPSSAPASSSTQALADMNWPSWNLSSRGYTGRNVKVGIVDSGFSNYHWNAVSAEGDLPPWPGISCNFGGQGTGTHGIAVAEIIHDIAPDATFVLATITTEVDIPNAMNCLANNGVHIISMSQGFGYRPQLGPGDGSGPIHYTISSLSANNGIFFSLSAGNSAPGYWKGYARDNNSNLWMEPNYQANEWIDIPNIPPNRSAEVNLRWTDNWSQACRDYDLIIYNQNWSLVSISQDTQGCNLPYPTYPVERAYVTNWTNSPQTYHIAIRSNDAPGVSHSGITFEILVRNSFPIDSQYQYLFGSLEQPADNGSYGVMAVGAVPSGNPNSIAQFSSRGPTKSNIVKPDIVAYTDIDAFMCTWPGVCNGSTFGGTSASQPHVAGAAALIKEAFPNFNGNAVRGFIDGAPPTPLGAPVPNPTFGRGRVRLGALPQVDLAITRFDYPYEVIVGDSVFYEITVTNIGATTATDVRITTTSPVYLNPSGQQQEAGCVASGQTITCQVGQLRPGESVGN